MSSSEDRTTAVMSASCGRARARAALAPDGELSLVETTLLQAHLRLCAPCATFSDDIQGFTATLRMEPQEAPRVEKPRGPVEALVAPPQASRNPTPSSRPCASPTSPVPLLREHS